MTMPSRQTWSALLRWVICVAAVSWVVYDTDWREVWRVLGRARWGLAAIGLLAFGPAPVLLAVRLKWLLAVHDVHLTFWRAVRVTFAGNFLIQMLPIGTSGGDSVKAYYVARETPHKHEAVMTVFFDRAIGVAGLLAMAGLAVLLNWGNPAFEKWGRTIGLLVLGLIVGGAVYFSNHMRGWLRIEAIVARLPFSTHLQRLDRAMFAFRHRAARLAACLGLTAVLQTTSVLALFLVGRALGMVKGSPLEDLPVFMAYAPICYLAGALPIGAMEVTFRELFADAAHLGTPEQAVSLSLVGARVVQLVWALPGGLWVLGAPPPLGADQILDTDTAAGGDRPGFTS